jgi:hypothetical protein
VPGRRVRRRDHLRRRARLGRAPRLLHRLAADFSDARHRGVLGRDHRLPHLLGQRRIQRLGVARTVLDFLPDGGHRDLHPPPAPGNPDLRGDQGQGSDDQEPVEGGLPHPELCSWRSQHR